MTTKVKQWGRWLLLVVALLLWFAWMLVLTGPSAALAERLASVLQEQTGGTWQLEYAGTGTYGWPGLLLEQPRVIHQVGESKKVIGFEQLRARMLWWPLCLGRFGGRVQARQGNGSLLVDAVAAGQALRSVQVHAAGLDLGQLAFVQPILGIALQGKVDGGFTSQLLGGSAADAEGSFSIAWQEAQIGPGQVMGMTVPGLPFGRVKLTGSIGKELLVLGNVEQEGGMIQLKTSGSIGLATDKGQETVLCVRIRIDPTWLAQNSALQAALRLAEMQLRRDGEGYLHVGLQGAILSPRLRPGLCT